jgi:hypothetical protein
VAILSFKTAFKAENNQFLYAYIFQHPSSHLERQKKSVGGRQTTLFVRKNL